MALENSSYKSQESANTTQETFPKVSKEVSELSKNKDVQEALHTMTDFCLKNAYSKEMKELNTVNCTEIYKQIIDKNPEALFFISGNLQLPVSQKNFSNLNGIQKMSFMSLYTILKEWKEKNHNHTSFQKLFQKKMETIITTINTRFELTNFTNLNKLEKTLKEMGVKEQAIPNVKEYLLWIQENMNIQHQEAGIGGYLIVLAIWIAIGALGYHKISNAFSTTPVDTYKHKTIEITDPIGVLELTLARMNFGTTQYAKTEKYQINENDGWVMKIGKKIGNSFQTSEIVLSMKGDINVTFDLQEKFNMTLDETTGIVEVYLWKPTIRIADWDFRVDRINNPIIQDQIFMNQQSEATKESKKKVLYQVENSPELYTRIKKAVTEKLKQQLNKYNPNINQVILHIEGDNQNRFTDDFKPAPTDEIKFNRVE